MVYFSHSLSQLTQIGYSHMKIEHTLSVPVSEPIIKERASAYFKNAGYRALPDGDYLVYERGSFLGSFISFSPRGWKVRAKVRTKPVSEGGTEARLLLDINTTGQLITEKERIFWRNELEGLLLAVKTGSPIPKLSSEAASNSKTENVTSAAVIISLAVMLAVIFKATYGTNVAGYLGGIIGTAVGFGITVLAVKIRRQK
jgi:hypothetical protein